MEDLLDAQYSLDNKMCSTRRDTDKSPLPDEMWKIRLLEFRKRIPGGVTSTPTSGTLANPRIKERSTALRENTAVSRRAHSAIYDDQCDNIARRMRNTSPKPDFRNMSKFSHTSSHGQRLPVECDSSVLFFYT